MDNQQEAQGTEPEGAPATPPSPATPTPSAPAKRKAGLSKGAVITLVVGIVAMVAVSFYAGEIKSFLIIKPWNKSAPCAVVDRFVEALKNGDVQTAKELLGGDKATVNVDPTSGRITTVKSAQGAPQMPPVDASKLIIAGKASSGQVKFEIGAVRRGVGITVKTEQGTSAVFGLTKDIKGKWFLIETAPGM